MSDQNASLSPRPILGELAGLWWLPLLRGIMLIILGAYALFRPGMTTATFVQVFGFFLAFDGVLAIIAGIMGHVPSRGWTILRGVLGLIVGIGIVGNPIFVAGVAAITFVYLLGFFSIVAGVMEIIAAIMDRKEIEGEGWMILGGVISVIFGICLIAAPLTFAGMLVMIIGVFAIIGGIASIVFAFRLRGLGKKIDKAESASSEE